MKLFSNILNRFGMIYFLYNLLVVSILNPFFLLDVGTVSVPVLYGLFSLFILIVALFTISNNNAKKHLNIIIPLSILLVSTLPALVIWLYFKKDFEQFSIYLSSFIISSLPIILLHSFWRIISSIQNKNTELADTKDAGTEIKDKLVFRIKDYRGNDAVNVPYEDILIFESRDNYVYTYYNDQGKNLTTTDRFSLKMAEKIIAADKQNFKRVHKSFIINEKWIESITGKSQAYKIKMKQLNREIPVSRNFDIDTITISPSKD